MWWFRAFVAFTRFFGLILMQTFMQTLRILCRFLHEKMLVGTSEPCLTSGLTLDLTSRFRDAFPQDCL